MPIVDLSSLGDDTAARLKECDICIIGSGPAGSTLACELSATKLNVILLESGGTTRLPEADSLNAVENVGREREPDQWTVRNRILGGSSHTWGGRCAPFDAIDFEARPWVPGSEWPFGLETLTPYLERSAAYLGLAVGVGFNDSVFEALTGRRISASGPDPNELLPFFWQFSRDAAESYPYEYMRFGRHLAERIGPNVTVVTGATATRINVVESGRAVQSVEFTSYDGRRRILAASAIVLATGGIENARLLLNSDVQSPRGLGNERDLVGRYLMDHIRGPVGAFDVKGSEALQQHFGRFNLHNHLFRAGLRLGPETQRREELLNCSAWLGEVLSESDPWDALRRVVSGKPRLQGDMRLIASNIGLLSRGLKQYFINRNGIPRRLEELSLVCMSEQRPDPESRVTLSKQRDPLGERLPQINWRVHEDESRTMRRMAELVAKECVRLGFSPPRMEAWVRDRASIPDTFLDVAHPTGTTRMSDHPSKGVVDADCCVHGIDGLYVAGSSVFPTAGHCNPTQMIVAMALRLSDHLKVRSRYQTELVRSPAAPRERSATRVLVTGATGRIGRVVVADLIERGYAVRAVTSKTPPDWDRGAVEWQIFDFQTSTDYDALLVGCDAVVHLAAEIGKIERMRRVNVEATQLLAEAAERNGVRAFCYASSVTVYGSGLKQVITEDSPVLTVERDVKSEYWALDYVREYGRTKLAGELSLRAVAQSVRYVVLRPTVVVSLAQILEIRDWSLLKRALASHRHAHHVYVEDVSDAMIWAIERGLTEQSEAGTVEVFNLSEDDLKDATHAKFMQKAFAVSGDPRFRIMVVPAFGDWLHDFLRFRTLPLRKPLWLMRFPNTKLRAAGWSPRFGMEYAHDRALDILRQEANSQDTRVIVTPAASPMPESVGHESGA